MESNLTHGTLATATAPGFYAQAILSTSVARVIAFAIEQLNQMNINEIIMRPTRQRF